MNDFYRTLRFRTAQWNALVYWMNHYSDNDDMPEAPKEVWGDLSVEFVDDNNKENNE